MYDCWATGPLGFRLIDSLGVEGSDSRTHKVLKMRLENHYGLLDLKGTLIYP